MTEDTLIIADTQVDKNSPLDHIRALGRYIWEHKPKRIIHIGDNWDLPSLSSYATLLEKEGRRLKDDLEGGFNALRIITEYIDEKNAKAKRKAYKPGKIFIMGNHENRLNRFLDNNPVLQGYFDLASGIEDEGWEVHNFLEPYWADGICYMHYMPNPMSNRPVGGGIENKLNKFPHSFVHGHQQQYQFGRRQNLAGKPHFGICAGSFYMHNEDYRGCNNTEIRGFVHLKAFTNRYDFIDFDCDFVSLERLLQNY